MCGMVVALLRVKGGTTFLEHSYGPLAQPWQTAHWPLNFEVTEPATHQQTSICVQVSQTHGHFCLTEHSQAFPVHL